MEVDRWARMFWHGICFRLKRKTEKDDWSELFFRNKLKLRFRIHVPAASKVGCVVSSEAAATNFF